MSSKSSVDTPSITDKPLPSAAQIRAEYQTTRAKHDADAAAAAEAAWQEHESSRRETFISGWIAENITPMPDLFTDGMSDVEIYRLSIPKESRIEGLCKLGCFDEAIKVLAYRHSGHVRVERVQEALRPYLPVDGDREFVTTNKQTERLTVQASNLSQELLNVLVGLESDLKVRDGEIHWITSTERIPRGDPMKPAGFWPDEVVPVYVTNDWRYRAYEW